jgi:hypothetical protein
LRLSFIARTRRPRDLKAIAPDAPKILRRNVYSWFERLQRGVSVWRGGLAPSGPMRENWMLLALTAAWHSLRKQRGT